MDVWDENGKEVRRRWNVCWTWLCNIYIQICVA